MADEYVIQESMDLGNDNTFDIVARRSLQVNDSNLGNYSGGEVLFDLSTIANSGAYVDWKQSKLQIPVVVQVTRSGATAGANDYDTLCASLKNGNFNILHSMTLNLSNQQVITLQGNMNGRISYELATKMSADDAERAIKFGYSFEDGNARPAASSISRTCFVILSLQP